MSAPSDHRRRPRDPRLDVLRGAGLIIIFIAHTAHNTWGELIPARFGFSDATEIFVFCSGVASAFAFGGTFRRAGAMLGTARVAHRMWQVYWAHLASWIAIVALMLASDRTFGGARYSEAIGLMPFLADPVTGLIGLVTLTYVPTYFDILPIYLIMLAMIPPIIGLSAISRMAPLAASLAIWALAVAGWLRLPADPWGESPWLFNPFAWQLLFFTGFSFGMGWIRVPGEHRSLSVLMVTILLLASPLAWHHAYHSVEILGMLRETIFPLLNKTDLGILRIIHFFALAYIVYHLAGQGGYRLAIPALEPIKIIGQQALAVFLAGMVLAQICGIGLDRLGADPLNVMLANLFGIGGLVATAYTVRWIKSGPWSAPRPAPEAAARGNPAAHAHLAATRPIR